LYLVVEFGHLGIESCIDLLVHRSRLKRRALLLRSIKRFLEGWGPASNSTTRQRIVSLTLRSRQYERLKAELTIMIHSFLARKSFSLFSSASHPDQAKGLINLSKKNQDRSIGQILDRQGATTGGTVRKDSLDERRLGRRSRVSNVEDEGNPSVHSNGLR